MEREIDLMRPDGQELEQPRTFNEYLIRRRRELMQTIYSEQVQVEDRTKLSPDENEAHSIRMAQLAGRLMEINELIEIKPIFDE